MLKAARFAESLLLEPSVAATYQDAFLLPPVMMQQLVPHAWKAAWAPMTPFLLLE